ncbi:hypothetical protein [Mycobacterium sp.]|uniref:hypothetical protein n=1 Tax=Mycobacterium sp. TaxID=1785 RepID=UPI0028BE9CB6|nr:hypothetical protein [Mycobacterium sp.]
MAQATGGKGTDMAQHAIQRPMRARLAIGTGLLAAGMLLVAPAATAFATPNRCTSVGTASTHCGNKGSDTATDTSTGTGTTGTMSHHPCAKPAPPPPPPPAGPPKE